MKKEKCKCGEGKVYTFRNSTLRKNIERCSGCKKIFYNKNIEDYFND